MDTLILVNLGVKKKNRKLYVVLKKLLYIIT